MPPKTTSTPEGGSAITRVLLSSLPNLP
jgi:hypothetical protein